MEKFQHPALILFLSAFNSVLSLVIHIFFINNKYDKMQLSAKLNNLSRFYITLFKSRK